MKKIILVFLLLFTVFIIYKYNTDKKIKYLYIGNNLYSKYNEIIKEYYNPKRYTEYIRNDDYRVMDLINEIKYNETINDKRIQNMLIKSNIIILNVGLYDIEYKKELDYKYVDGLISDIEMLLTIIRKYNKDKIYLLGFNNKNRYYSYLNDKLNLICKNKKITYINIEKSLINQLY